MGKKDSFNVGDLVFAKVKGYPAWPAKIIDITKSKKYSVYFYGTGETANVQGKDITLYVKSKEKLASSSSMKKQDFKMAIDQIEAALKGEDSAPNSYEIPLDRSNATFDSTVNSTINSTLDTTVADANSTNITESQIEEENDDTEANFESKDESVEYPPPNDTTIEAADDITVPTKGEQDTETSPVTKEISKAEVKSDIKSETKSEMKSEMKSETKADDKNISRSGRLIKKTKYLHDEFEEPPQVPVKRKRPSESQTPAPKMARKNDDSVLTEDGDGEKKPVSQTIMNEITLLQYDVDIKSSLQLSSADTSRCIAVLEKYKHLDITALMLKKNPQVAETIKRLRRYVGNTKEWNFSDEQQITFNDKAAKIRKLAEIIYKNFKKLFNFPQNVPFWQSFTDEVQSFKEQTKKLSHEELIVLTEDIPPANVNQNLVEMKNTVRV